LHIGLSAAQCYKSVVASNDRSDFPAVVETREVDTEVVAVLPEFNQAELRSADGFRYALTEQTPGIRLSNVREGQHFRCVVTLRYPRVLRAELLR
jgi:hypothetical protein